MGTALQTAQDIRKRSYRALANYRQSATSTALAALDPSGYQDGVPVFVRDTQDVYEWDSTSTATPDGTTIIQPDAGGDGRWLLQTELPTNPGGLPTKGFATVTTLPTSPTAGDSVILQGEPMSWNGSRWTGFDGNTTTATLGTASVLEVVTGGDTHEPSSHDYADGIAVAVDGSTLIVRRKGIVDGFTSLTPGQLYVAGPGGSLVATSAGLQQLTYIARAVSATAVYVDVERSIGI